MRDDVYTTILPIVALSIAIAYALEYMGLDRQTAAGLGILTQIVLFSVIDR